MKRAQRATTFATLALIASLLFFGACGGDNGDGGGDVEGKVERTTCRPATPVSPRTPVDLPAGLAEYVSPERGYVVKYPADWQVQPNGVAVQNIAGDIFYTVAAQGAVKPNISVSCETIPLGTTSEAFFKSKSDVIEHIVGIRPQISKRLIVDGNEALLVEYPVVKERTPEPVKIDKVEVYFADELGGWTIALVVPQGMVEQYRAVFDDFVASFERP